MANPLALRLDAYTRLSQDDRAAIERASRRSVRVVPARQDLIRESDPPRSVNLILEGWACRYKMLPDGRRQIVAFSLPGDFCDLNVYILKEMDHGVSAITRLKVAEIGRDDMDRLTAGHPRITQALWWHDLVSTSIQREWALNLGQRSAYERIGHLLVELFFRLRIVGQVRGDRCDFPATQGDLAEATGLTPVHVNRMLQELRRDRLIELERRELRIPDLKALMTASMFNANYLHLDHEGRHLDAND